MEQRCVLFARTPCRYWSEASSPDILDISKTQGTFSGALDARCARSEIFSWIISFFLNFTDIVNLFCRSKSLNSDFCSERNTLLSAAGAQCTWSRNYFSFADGSNEVSHTPGLGVLEKSCPTNLCKMRQKLKKKCFRSGGFLVCLDETHCIPILNVNVYANISMLI